MKFWNWWVWKNGATFIRQANSLVQKCTFGSSSEASGGGLSPYWQAEYAKYPIFSTFETNFCTKSENSPSHWHWQWQWESDFFDSGLEENLSQKIDLNLGEDLSSGHKTVPIPIVNCFSLVLLLRNSFLFPPQLQIPSYAPGRQLTWLTEQSELHCNGMSFCLI